MKFEELSLSEEVLSGIRSSDFKECTPVQEAIIPLILEGKDVYGLSQTGTGKTAAFLIPLIERVFLSVHNIYDRTDDKDDTSKDKPQIEPRAEPRAEPQIESQIEPQIGPQVEQNKASQTSPDQAPDKDIQDQLLQRVYPHWKKGHFILIMVPTRELAQQVHEDIQRLKGDTQIRSVLIYGGSGYETQKEQLTSPFEFIVSTPGRLIDLYKQHFIDLKQCCGVVFDEADRMFDMGFKDDMQFLLYRMSKTRQILLFSATLNFDVNQMVYQFGANPIEFNFSRDDVKAENIDDQVYHIGTEEKPQYLLSIFKKFQPKQAIVFSNFKNHIGRIVHFLNENGYQTVGMSSLLPQNQRKQVIEHFKSAQKQSILVATDVAARGLDIKEVDLVVNFDLPEYPENYVHRMGRTGRAGRAGQAISLASEKDIESLMRIENYLKNKVTVGWLEDDEIIQDFKAFPDHYTALPNVASESLEGTSQKGKGKKTSEEEKYKRKSSSQGQSMSTRRSSYQKQGVHRDRVLGRHKQGISNKRKKTYTTAQKKDSRKKTSHKIIRRSSKKTFYQKTKTFLKKFFFD